MRLWQNTNRDKMRAASTWWKTENAERVKAYDAASKRANGERNLVAYRAWAARNKDHVKARRAEWLASNYPRVLALNSAYRAAEVGATPAWLTDEHKAQIRALYEDAQRLTAETGVKHHVDHIVPLRGETVTGLHVPWNLRVITAAENVRKKNKLIPALALAS